MTEEKPKRGRGRPSKFGENMTRHLYTRLTPGQDKLFQELVGRDPRYKDTTEAIRGLILDAIERGHLP